MSRQFYGERPADSAFWEKLQKEWKEYADSAEPVPWENTFYEIHPFATLPDKLHDQWKKEFQEKNARVELEKMLEQPLPPAERNYCAWVWLNGVFIGDHDLGPTGWNMPFSLDVTEEIRWGEPNQITIRVQDDAMAGGIYLPIQLQIME